MSSTFVNSALFLGLLIASTLLNALWLCVGLRWAKAQDVSLRRSLLATCLGGALQVLVIVGFYFISQSNTVTAQIVASISLLVIFLIPIFVIGFIFKITFLRSLQAWLPTNLGSIMMLLFTVCIFRPFIIEAFKGSSNSMAPTILGDHWQGTCEECGNRAYCSPGGYNFSRPALQICERKFHVTNPDDSGKIVFPADRFLVTKFLKPRRWDLIVFKKPDNPSNMYLMRVVGLQGELITIENGQVHANGTAQIPPESIGSVTYLTEIDALHPLWGTAENPAQLKDDEYFVLGDFSARANDSRLWIEGAPGHNPYAVPASYISGVVTQVYWPPSRWKSFR